MEVQASWQDTIRLQQGSGRSQLITADLHSCIMHVTRCPIHGLNESGNTEYSAVQI